MAEEEDFLRLPLEERWRHAKWSARQSAYKEALALAETGAQLPPMAASVDAISAAACDSNVVALDTGIKLLAAVAVNCGQQVNLTALQSSSLKQMVEKGLVAAKPSVKQSAVTTTLTFVEVASNPDTVIDDLLAVLAKARMARLASAILSVLAQIYTEFGGPVADPKPVLKILASQFAHTDRNVRASAVELSAALKRWVGVAALEAVLKDIKPVQLKELQQKWAEANPATNGPPARLTRKQAAAIERSSAANTASGNDAGSLDAPTPAEDAANLQPMQEAIDPWELTTPVSILDKMPANFDEQLQSPKWKERKEALDNLLALLEKAPRLSNGDYHPLVSALEHVLAKDSNQQCASLAVTSVRLLVTGLRNDFAPYANRLINSLIERFREKKQSFTDSLSVCLDALSKVTGLSALLEPLLGGSGLGHKVPVVKVGAGKYIAHLLQLTTKPPSATEVTQTGKAAVLLLNDTTEPVRQAGAEILGTLEKIVGPQNMASILAGVDDLRKARVQEAAAKINVKSTAAKPVPVQPVGATPRAQGARRPEALAATRSMPAPSTKRPTAAVPTLQPPSLRTLGGNRNPPSSPLRRPPPASMHSAPDSDMIISSPPRGAVNMPTTASTPKVPKRSSHAVDFTPVRQQVANRRRLVSPEKQGMATDTMEQVNPSALATLTMQLSHEKRRREQAEAMLARSQSAHNKELERLTEKLAETQMQLDVARGELGELQTQLAQSQMSSLSLSRKESTARERAERRHSQMFGDVSLSASTHRSSTDRRSLDRNSTDLYKTTTPRVEGRSDWERAVKVTADLRRRINDLKQERQA